MTIAMPADAPPSYSSPPPPHAHGGPGSPPWHEDSRAPEPPAALHERTSHGRLRLTAIDEQERMLGVAMHLWWLATLLPTGPLAALIPVGLWLWKRNQSPWLDDNGREVINFGLSQVILSLGLCLTVVGVLLLPVLWIVGIVNVVRGAIAAGRGEYFRYPMTFRML